MDTTDINLVVRHNGLVYARHHKIHYTTASRPELNEMEYQVVRAWALIKRDIEHWEAQSKQTNPFAWSTGPR